MENEKTLSKYGANGAVADKDLESVSGGALAIEFGSMGATTQSALNRMNVIDGSKCPSCGGTVGIFAMNANGDLYVKCEKCGATILTSFRSDAVSFI